jgi:hypothetical protein
MSSAPRHVELLVEAEAQPPFDDPDKGTDDGHAFELSWRLVGFEAQLHVAWLRAVANRFVTDHAQPIAAVARELFQRTVIPGTAAAAIVERIREENEVSISAAAKENPDV